MSSIKSRNRDIKKEKELSARRLYELAIAKEIGERIGYSLDVEEILNVITGSLRQFLDYTSVSYFIIEKDKLKLNFYLERSVGHSFFLNVKEKMLASLEAVSGKSFRKMPIDEIISGAIEIDDEHQNIGSFFNIPLVIGGELSAILTVAHIEKGLYKEEDMTILYKIVNQASTAVTRLQELIKSEQGKLNSMVESIGEGILMVDKEFRVVVANPAIKEIVGLPETGQISVFDFVDRLGGKFDIRGRIEEVVIKMSPFISDRIEVGKEFFAVGVYPVARIVDSNKREVLGVVVVFHNVSRDVEVERVKEEFMSMIVHQLRSPLDNMKKTAELLIKDKNTVNADENNMMIYQGASSMLELVNEMLDISKIRAGKFEVHKVSANPREMILGRVEFYKVLANSKKISITSAIDPSVPEKLDFDPNATKQILNNFISNALKYTKENGAVSVSGFVFGEGDPIPQGLNVPKDFVFPTALDMKISQKSLCLVVSDNGVGIPESSINNLFSSYTEMSMEGVETENGTGLGLFVAKEVARSFGGRVGAVSILGRGSSFYLVIPI
jgi:signal transduction histidine kinase